MMATIDLNLRLQPSDAVMQKVRDSGLLTPEKLSEWMTAEIERLYPKQPDTVTSILAD